MMRIIMKSFFFTNMLSQIRRLHSSVINESEHVRYHVLKRNEDMRNERY